MNSKILVDSIMRQTTVLIAQLTASAGIRAPMARLADEVFLTLSEELENEGLSRKVVADMFGMALRGYQRRVQRLKRGAGGAERTLWSSMLEFIETQGPLPRDRILGRFTQEDPNAVRSVLQDLINSGLVLRQGSGDTTLLLALPEEQRSLLARKGSKALIRTMVWLDLTHHPGSSRQEVADRLGFEVSDVNEAVSSLQEDEQVTDTDGGLVARSIYIGVGSTAGWETAVFDHFQAVCAALITKLRGGSAQSDQTDLTGGSTVTFDLYEGHPLGERAQSLLRETRERVNAVWAEVEEENAKNPIPSEKQRQLTFYFGQYLQETEDGGDE